MTLSPKERGVPTYVVCGPFYLKEVSVTGPFEALLAHIRVYTFG
jgi:hypothetical protein